MQTHTNQPTLRAERMTLFPQMDSLDDVMNLAKTKVPSIERNELHALFMTYHNTLLNQIQAK